MRVYHKATHKKMCRFFFMPFIFCLLYSYIFIKQFKEKVFGAYALGIMNSDEVDTLYAIKMNSPLKLLI